MVSIMFSMSFFASSVLFFSALSVMVCVLSVFIL